MVRSMGYQPTLQQKVHELLASLIFWKISNEQNNLFLNAFSRSSGSRTSKI
jgi:hypothetical protein